MSMTAETTQGFTASDAARTLDELKGYEETLSARTAGLTILVWAFVVAGIPLSYQGLWWWLSQQGTWGGVASALLWVPWVVAGIVVTTMLWRTHSIRMQKKEENKWGWLINVGFTALFFVLAGGVFLVFGPDTDTFAAMGVTTGLLTLAIAMANHLKYKQGRFWLPFYSAGMVILATGLILVAMGAERDVAAFTTVFVQGFAYFIAGSIMVLRG